MKFLASDAYLTMHQAVPQRQLDGRAPIIPQARLLGGGSAVNAMVYMRGQAADYDGWDRYLGQGSGWSYADLLPHFKTQEDNDHLADAYHGVGGPLKVSHLGHHCTMSRAFVKTMQGLGVPYNPDFNGAAQGGVGFMQHTIDPVTRRRCSARDAFLAPVLGNPRLTVVHAGQRDRDRAGGQPRRRRALRRRRRRESGARLGRGDPDGGRLHHAEAADALRHRPGGTAQGVRHRRAGRPQGRGPEPAGPSRGAGGGRGQRALWLFPAGPRPRHAAQWPAVPAVQIGAGGDHGGRGLRLHRSAGQRARRRDPALLRADRLSRPRCERAAADRGRHADAVRDAAEVARLGDAALGRSARSAGGRSELLRRAGGSQAPDGRRPASRARSCAPSR